MKLFVNGREVCFGVDKFGRSEAGLDIRVEIDPAGEEVGPVRITMVGGHVTARGNAEHQNGFIIHGRDHITWADHEPGVTIIPGTFTAHSGNGIVGGLDAGG